jgi:hypothetical protein
MCCVPNCNSYYRDKVSLFSFPKPGDRRHKQWVHKLRIGKQIGKRFRVCSLHFTEEDLIPPSSEYWCLENLSTQK